jgi:hypothetical protein
MFCWIEVDAACLDGSGDTAGLVKDVLATQAKVRGSSGDGV